MIPKVGNLKLDTWKLNIILAKRPKIGERVENWNGKHRVSWYKQNIQWDSAAGGWYSMDPRWNTPGATRA